MSEYIPSEKVRAWASANGFEKYLDAHLEYFQDFMANMCRKPYKDLDAAFRNCVRGDWGGIRKQLEIKERFKTPTVFNGSTNDARPGETMEAYLARLKR